jgi:DNA repair protein RadC
MCVIAEHDVCKGGLSEVHVRAREVFRPLVLDSAHACVVVHNHPSGDPEPSGDDIALTRRLVEAGKVLGIPVLDHLVVGAAGYVSLRERNPSLFDQQ